MTVAAGVATAGSLAGASTAAADMVPAAGVSTASTMVGSSTAAGTADMVPAAGQATTATMVGSSVAASDMVPAAGVATTGTLSANDASAVATNLGGSKFQKRDTKPVDLFARIKREDEEIVNALLTVLLDQAA
jgi:hypothetical protein